MGRERKTEEKNARLVWRISEPCEQCRGGRHAAKRSGNDDHRCRLERGGKVQRRCNQNKKMTKVIKVIKRTKHANEKWRKFPNKLSGFARWDEIRQVDKWKTSRQREVNILKNGKSRMKQKFWTYVEDGQDNGHSDGQTRTRTNWTFPWTWITFNQKTPYSNGAVGCRRQTLRRGWDCAAPRTHKWTNKST